MSTKIYPPKKPRFEKLEKKEGPAPGSYNIEESITKTQWINKKAVVDKSQITSFVDVQAKLRKHNPGVGTYKEAENAYSKLSKSPLLGCKRH